MIPFLDLKSQYAVIGSDLEAAVVDVLRRGDYILGSSVASFEKNFATYCGAKEAVALNTGTSALHLALLALDIGPGDEFITVPMTFVATVAAIRYVNARPVFVDIDPETWTMDPVKLEEAITPRTRVICRSTCTADLPTWHQFSKSPTVMASPLSRTPRRRTALSSTESGPEHLVPSAASASTRAKI